MLITSTLIFLFLAFMAVCCILILQALATSSRLKLGYAALAASFVLWVWNLYIRPTDIQSWWLYALPILWLILLFLYAFPKTRLNEFPSMPGEPRFTQEALGGARATREALIFYFLLLLIGLILGLVFFEMSLLYP